MNYKNTMKVQYGFVVQECDANEVILKYFCLAPKI